MFTSGNLEYALDCITDMQSTAICHEAIGRAGGKYVSLAPPSEDSATRKTVSRDWVHGPSIFGEGSTWPAPYARPPSDELRQFGAYLWQIVSRLAEEGKLRHHPLRVLDGNLESVLEGMRLVRSGRISGEKVVVRMNT